MQAGLVQWESQLLALERDHKEVLSPKVKRAFLMNVLPAAMQNRVMEHLDRLKNYAEVREKIVALCQTASGLDEADCGQVEHDWQDGCGGNWQEEDWSEEADLQELADMKRHRCGGQGHMARNCSTPAKGNGKAGKSGGKGQGQQGRKGAGKGGQVEFFVNNVGKRDIRKKDVGFSTPS